MWQPYQKWKRLVPSNIDQTLAIIQSHLDKGDEANAEKLLREALEDSPQKKFAAEELRRLKLLLREKFPGYSEPTTTQIQKLIDLYDKGELSKVIEHALALTDLFPNAAVLHNILGAANSGLRHYEAAILNYRKLMQIKPDYAEAYNYMGIALQECGNQVAAIENFEKALAIKPNLAEAYYNLGASLREKGDLEAAADSYLKAIELKPDYAEAYNNLGITQKRRGNLSAAIDCYNQALVLNPDNPEAYHNRGLALSEAGDLDAAISSYTHAISIKPHYAEACNNLGVALRAKRHLEAAIDAYTKALQINPEYLDAHINMGNCLRDTGKLVAAVDSYASAINLDNDSADAHFNLSLTWLLQGEYEKGWAEYEWRLRRENTANYSDHPSPRWNRQSVRGKSLLLLAEQGLGDMIQTIYYAKQLKSLGAQLFVECKKPLIPLFGLCEHIDVLIPEGAPLPPADYHAPMMSLPGILGESFSARANTEPYLQADPEFITKWAHHLGSIEAYKIGIAWQGSTTFVDDQWRSFPLQNFSSIAGLSDTSLVSLQKGIEGRSQIDSFCETSQLLDFGEDLDRGRPFMDTAGIMMNVDLVITSCTSIAHLAGSLGVPTWVILGENADWRWLLDREDSPWYPNVRLFRQQKRGNWEEVFARVTMELQLMINGPNNTRSSF